MDCRTPSKFRREMLAGHVLIRTFSLFWYGQLAPEVRPRILHALCIKYTFLLIESRNSDLYYHFFFRNIRYNLILK